MKHGGRLRAAIEVLEDMEQHHRPAREAVRDWGLSHRFAGSGDRAAIGNLVFDALRWRASNAWRMNADSARALVLATDIYHWETTLADLEAALADDRHAPEGLTSAERQALSGGDLAGAPEWVRADVPEWIAPHLEANFDDSWVEEGAAFAARAPLDLRVNTLKAEPGKILPTGQAGFSSATLRSYISTASRLPMISGTRWCSPSGWIARMSSYPVEA